MSKTQNTFFRFFLPPSEQMPLGKLEEHSRTMTQPTEDERKRGRLMLTWRRMVDNEKNQARVSELVRNKICCC
ncbi:hypothetical protein CEXT_540281 [Caerostris extrusa]|uniref:Uncharacterized protein n=1 Tax=Caerostris extrusa TaxID=172846 RepID=A0AAV4Y585_CAEEX|nr:hypothetical protein CEXT_540281 [Caerostris extrusa]